MNALNRTIALGTVAIAAVVVVFAAAPLIADMMQAHAFWVPQNDNSQGNNNIQGRFGFHGAENTQGNQP